MPIARAKRTRIKRPHLLRGLGLVGLDDIEPVVVAAAAAELPMLLVGPHGTGKSLLLTRVAEALGLTWRHYNASLLNYDDLIGYPVPDGKGGLEYLRTPATIWDAQAVFLDEINRCRPDLQNKLFPIVHERRVQGIELERLSHRWAAMNPVDREAEDDPYLGAEPLDAALADRFAFVVPMPDWRALRPRDQDRLLLSDLQPPDPAAAERFREAVLATRQRYLEAVSRPELPMAVYVRHALRLLDEADLRCSARRGTTLVRAIAAVRATQLVDDDRAPLVALRMGLPQRASGGAIHEGKILAAHREALAAATAPADDPVRNLRSISDPLDRAAAALELSDVDATARSGAVADAFADLRSGARHALALYAFENELADGLVGSVAAQLAEVYQIVVTPQNVSESVHNGSSRHQAWQEVTRLVARKREKRENALIENLLVGQWGGGELTQPDDVSALLESWSDARSRLLQRPSAEDTAQPRGRRSSGRAAA